MAYTDVINTYQWTLPTGNTIQASGTTIEQALVKAEDMLNRYQSQGTFPGMTPQQAFSGQPQMGLAGAHEYIKSGLDIPVGTPINQNLNELSPLLEGAGYKIENGTISYAPNTNQKMLGIITGSNSLITDEDKKMYDLNADGEVNLSDVLAYQKHEQGLRPLESVTNLEAYNSGTYTSPNQNGSDETLPEASVPEEPLPETPIDSTPDPTQDPTPPDQPEPAVKYYVVKDNAGNLSIVESAGVVSRGRVFTGSTRGEAEAYINSQKTEKELEREAVDEAKERQPISEPVSKPPAYVAPEREYKPLDNNFNQPYNPQAPVYTQPAQVAQTFNPQTSFSPQYVAGPVQQTVSLPANSFQQPSFTMNNPSQIPSFADGGDVNLNSEYQLATKFLGYKGPMTRAGLNNFMKASPGAAARMGKYQQAMGMYRGGVVGYDEGGDAHLHPHSEAVNPEDATNEFTNTGTEYNDTYTEELLPEFKDTVSKTLDPVQSSYATIAPSTYQEIDPSAGQIGTYAPSVSADQVASVSQAGTPEYAQASTYGATTGAEGVAAETAKVKSVTGEVSDQAQVDAAQGTSSLNIDAAQGTATMMTNPVTREIQDGELISGVADAQKAAKFTEQIQAAQATPSKQATVAGQLEGLMQQFEGGNTPAWAAGAMRNAMGAMAARGLGASSLAGQAAVQAAMESALPIASADAQTIASFEAQNLSNRQQRAMLGAQQRAQFMGQEFDQAFQARVQNSSRIADIANMNFTAEQQVALENSRAANTMNLANLSNRQAGVMAEAAAIANMDMANLNNRQQAAVQNAQNFMAMDMSNLDRAQQTALFRSQQNIQALFTDQAAENAAKQFNASSDNQTKQFFASLSSQTSQFNAAQTNAVNQFNVNSSNAVNQFNANLQQQRDTFNASNGLVVAQANAQWRQTATTLNTAAANASNMSYAAALNGLTAKNIDNIWQRERDLMSYNITSVESSKDRAMQILLGEQTLTALREKIGYAEDSAESEFFTRFLFGDFKDLFK